MISREEILSQGSTPTIYCSYTTKYRSYSIVFFNLMGPDKLQCAASYFCPSKPVSSFRY